MIVLGINAYHPDAAAALMKDASSFGPQRRSGSTAFQVSIDALEKGKLEFGRVEAKMDRSVYSSLIKKLEDEVRSFYGNRLVTFAIFGSYARNQMRSDSDLDILIIAEDLPKGRMRRAAEFLEIEKKISFVKEELAEQSLHPYFSPVFKTKEEAARGALLFLDMTDEIEILFDRDGFFRNVLDRLKKRLKELGSKRIWKGKMWYWVLKPDSKPGEVISL